MAEAMLKTGLSQGKPAGESIAMRMKRNRESLMGATGTTQPVVPNVGAVVNIVNVSNSSNSV